jgi:hypothetical protein
MMLNLQKFRRRKARGLTLRMSNSFSGCLGAKDVTLKALANFSPGRGPHAGSPRGVEVFALKPWVQKKVQENLSQL